MNKIIDSKKNILKICAGNDFSIVVQITEYDTETGAWVNYDLSAVNDVHMTLVAENGKHIKLPVVVNEDGTVSAPVQAAYLQKSTYGIELTWVTNDLNRRTYSPCLMQIVTTTAESSSNIAEYESNDAYHFNIKMHADVAVLSIGKISDEYVTEDELQDELENYVTNSALSTTLNDYATVSSLEDYATVSSLEDYATKQYVDDELASIDLSSYAKLEDLGSYAKLEDLSSYATKQYVDDELANIDLTDYYTKSDIDTTLESYVTDSELNTAISPFITNLDLSNVLENYVSNVALEQDLEDYAKFEDLSSYAKFEDLSSYATLADLSSYVTYSYFSNTVDPIDARVTALENEPQVPSNVVTSYDGTYIYCLTQAEYDSLQQLDPDTFYYITDASTNYATLSDLSSYATKQYVDNEISSIDLSSYATLADLNSYATTQYVDNEIASIDLSSYAKFEDLSSYAKFEDLSSYVTYTDWDNSNEAIAYELTNNRLAHLSINDNFDNYYTKTESDNKYAAQSWANGKFVTQADDVNRQQAIAAAFASSVQSTSVHNIWTGSQNDYDAITTKDTNTLYVIL